MPLRSFAAVTTIYLHIYKYTYVYICIHKRHASRLRFVDVCGEHTTMRLACIGTERLPPCTSCLNNLCYHPELTSTPTGGHDKPCREALNRVASDSVPQDKTDNRALPLFFVHSTIYRVAKTHRMPYPYRSFSARDKRTLSLAALSRSFAGNDERLKASYRSW